MTPELSDTITPVTVTVTGDEVALRTISNGAPTSLGVYHSGDTVSSTVANTFGNTGAFVNTTSVLVAGGSGSTKRQRGGR